jgi:hypothetical protein
MIKFKVTYIVTHEEHMIIILAYLKVFSIYSPVAKNPSAPQSQ